MHVAVLFLLLLGCFCKELRVQSVIVGSTTNLNCTDHNSTVWQARANWFFSRHPPSKNGSQGTQLAVAQRQARYTIRKAAYNDSGYYRCVSSGVEVSVVKLIVGKSDSHAPTQILMLALLFSLL